MFIINHSTFNSFACEQFTQRVGIQDNIADENIADENLLLYSRDVVH
jgi:hypothetical protein